MVSQRIKKLEILLRPCWILRCKLYGFSMRPRSEDQSVIDREGAGSLPVSNWSVFFLAPLVYFSSTSIFLGSPDSSILNILTNTYHLCFIYRTIGHFVDNLLCMLCSCAQLCVERDVRIILNCSQGITVEVSQDRGLFCNDIPPDTVSSSQSACTSWYTFPLQSFYELGYLERSALRVAWWDAASV